MAEVLPLTALIRGIQDRAERPLAWRAGSPASSIYFVRRACAWRTVFAAAPGSRYALHHDDSFEFAAAMFGAWDAGKTIYLPADKLDATLQSLAAQVDGFAGGFPNALQADPIASAAISSSSETTWNDLDPETIRLVLYTSGSSGDPVAIAKNLRQLDSEIATLESRFGSFVGDTVVHGTVSHQHIYGLLFRVLWPLAASRTFATHRLEYPEQIAALDPLQPAVLIASPALLKRLPESIDWSNASAALRVVFSSGGPLPAQARAAADRLWMQSVIEVFGSTETGGIATRSGSDGPWRPLPGVECRVEESTLYVRSQHLAEAGWFQTGDRACLREGGFELLGRSDRLVKLEERRVSLDAIEAALNADERIDEARVLVLAGQRERIGAVLVLSGTGHEMLSSAARKILIDRLRDGLRPQIEAIAIPRYWRFVDAMPANAQGKTTHRQLADLFAGRPLPRWQECSADAARLLINVTSDLAVFDGHFPDIAILPGVAMIDWVIHWGRDAFAISQPFLRMEALKFQQLVRPDAQLQLNMSWRAETEILQFSFRSAHGAHASGRIVFARVDEPA